MLLSKWYPKFISCRMLPCQFWQQESFLPLQMSLLRNVFSFQICRRSSFKKRNKSSKWISVCVLSHFSHVPFSVTTWTVACQAALAMRFSWQECRSGMLWAPPGLCSNLGTEPTSPASQADSLLLIYQGIPSESMLVRETKQNNKPPWDYFLCWGEIEYMYCRHILSLFSPSIWKNILIYIHLTYFFYSHYSVKSSRSVMSDSMQPHGLQHTRPPPPSLTNSWSLPKLMSWVKPKKTIALIRWTFVGKVMSLLFNILSRLIITFLPRSKHLLISWLQSPSTVILEPPRSKVSHCFPIYCHEVMGPDAMILVFWILSFKPTFWLSSFTFIKRFFSSSSLSAIRVVSHLHIWGCWYFSRQSWFQLVLHPAQHFLWCTLHIS